MGSVRLHNTECTPEKLVSEGEKEKLQGGGIQLCYNILCGAQV